MTNTTSSATSYTLRNLYTDIANGVAPTQEMKDRAKDALAQMDSAATKRKAASASKSASTNQPLVDAVTALMQGGRDFTASELADLAKTEPALADIGSASKATYILKAVPNVKVGSRVVGSRAVKVYSL